jgi:membrane-bound lytic murein transglycosylase D
VAYSPRATRYRVRKGDTLGSIADDFEVPVDKVRKWNHLKGNTVTVGRTLLIYKPLLGASGPQVAPDGEDPPPSKSAKANKAPAATSKSSAKAGSKSTASSQTATYHKVKKGETLSGIAQSYNTTVADLKKNNANLSANLRVGEVLLIRK